MCCLLGHDRYCGLDDDCCGDRRRSRRPRHDGRPARDRCGCSRDCSRCTHERSCCNGSRSRLCQWGHPRWCNGNDPRYRFGNDRRRCCHFRGCDLDRRRGRHIDDLGLARVIVGQPYGTDHQREGERPPAHCAANLILPAMHPDPGFAEDRMFDLCLTDVRPHMRFRLCHIDQRLVESFHVVLHFPPQERYSAGR